MSSPNRLNFEDIPETPGDNGLPPPDSPVIPRGPAAPDSPVAAAAGAPLNSQGAQSPSREELEDFYRELDRSRRFNRQLFLEAENEDEEDPEVAMLEERFGEELINAYVALSGAGWISAIKRDHGYEPLQDGLVPRSGAAGKKRKKTTKTTKKKKKRQRKRGGGKKKKKKKRTKKKSRRRTKKRRKKKTRKKRGGYDLDPRKIYFYKRVGSNWIFKGTYIQTNGTNVLFNDWSGSQKQGENIGRIGGDGRSYTEDIRRIEKIWRFYPRAVQQDGGPGRVLPEFLSERISGFVGGKSRKKKKRKTRR